MSRAEREAEFRAAYDAMLRLWPAPPEARVVETPSARTHVHVWGAPDAPPLVMLHGYQVTSTMWAASAEALGAIRRVYAPDTPGDYGWSVAAARARSVADLVRWLDELLDALELDAVDLGGMSYGGWLSLHYAAAHPERVRKLVLLAPGATFGSFSAAWMMRGLPMLVVKRRGVVEQFLRWAAVASPDDARYEALMAGVVDLMHAGNRLFKPLGLPLPKVLPPEVAARVQAPTLVLYGAEEKMFPAARAVAIARERIAGVEAIVVPEASHDLPFRQAARVDAELTRFLTTASASPRTAR